MTQFEPKMTLHFSDTKSFSRSENKSAVASIAYRSGTKLRDDRYNKTHDYSAKSKHVTSADIILPRAFKGADIELDRETIWNDAERAEKRKDSRVAREWLINLPYALDEQTRKELAHSFAQKLADRYNVIADCCIHKPAEKEIAKGANPRNFHAHIMLTTREIDVQNGQIVFTKKAISELSDTDRKKLGLSRMSEEIPAIKQLWDDTANPVLKAHGLPEMDWRSHEAKGDDLLPQVKMGVAATAMERKGKRTKLGDINRQIKQKNEIIFESRRQHERETDSFIKASNQRITERKREIDFVRVIVARSNHEIRVRERTFDQTERNVKYIVNGSKLNARQREARLSLTDENKRRVTDTERAVTDSKRTADDTDRVIASTVNEFEQRKRTASDTDRVIENTAQYVNQQRIERKRQAQLERERRERIERERLERLERERLERLERERIYSVNRLSRSLQLSKNEKGYDFENANIVYDEFLRHYEPLSQEQIDQYNRVAMRYRDINRGMGILSNGLLQVVHFENVAAGIKRLNKYYDLSDVAELTPNGRHLDLKNVGISIPIDYQNIDHVREAMQASERHKRQLAQPQKPLATPKATLEQSRDEPKNTYKPRF